MKLIALVNAFLVATTMATFLPIIPTTCLPADYYDDDACDRYCNAANSCAKGIFGFKLLGFNDISNYHNCWKCNARKPSRWSCADNIVKKFLSCGIPKPVICSTPSVPSTCLPADNYDDNTCDRYCNAAKSCAGGIFGRKTLGSSDISNYHGCWKCNARKPSRWSCDDKVVKKFSLCGVPKPVICPVPTTPSNCLPADDCDDNTCDKYCNAANSCAKDIFGFKVLGLTDIANYHGCWKCAVRKPHRWSCSDKLVKKFSLCGIPKPQICGY